MLYEKGLVGAAAGGAGVWAVWPLCAVWAFAMPAVARRAANTIWVFLICTVSPEGLKRGWLN
jgi:hypothetical protein